VHDKVALVTGAGRGIGRETALGLARLGVRVMAVARSAAELESLVREAPSIEYTSVSLADPEGCAHAVDETRRRLGAISILVNNAGVGSADDREIWDQPFDAFRSTMALNLEAPFLLTQQASRDMRSQRWGRIVMVSSTSGIIGSPRNVAYVTSKHALIGLMRATAQDVGAFAATCNAVLPGWVRTAMADRSAERTAHRTAGSVDQVWTARDAMYPRGYSLTPREVADVIVFLCSDGASGVNGETITVTAGGVE
jgi:NAD(P)-dependent dehydrogenase (short-subunit alcohol dehydrogenase family)